VVEILVGRAHHRDTENTENTLRKVVTFIVYLFESFVDPLSHPQWTIFQPASEIMIREVALGKSDLNG
jgi:hypothetical protein